jgi:hypothetical protein
MADSQTDEEPHIVDSTKESSPLLQSSSKKVAM